MTIAMLCAIAVGSLGGSLAAIRLHPTPTDPPPPPPPKAAAPTAPAMPAIATTTPPAPIAQPHAPDPQAVLVIQMRAILGRIAEWSHAHTGEPCPDAATL